MNTAITLRREVPADHHAVELLTREAFWNLHAPAVTSIIWCMYYAIAMLSFLNWILWRSWMEQSSAISCTPNPSSHWMQAARCR